MKYFSLQQIAISLLPVSLRRPVVAAILRSALSTMVDNHNTIYDYHYRDYYGTRYILAHGSQRIVLESLLNDRFDPSHRRIRIGDVGGNTALYIYTDNEITLQPWLSHYLNDVQYIYDTSECIDQSDADFLVVCPSDLAYLEANIRASVDYFKLCGVSYDVVFN